MWHGTSRIPASATIPKGLWSKVPLEAVTLVVKININGNSQMVYRLMLSIETEHAPYIPPIDGLVPGFPA